MCFFLCVEFKCFYLESPVWSVWDMSMQPNLNLCKYSFCPFIYYNSFIYGLLIHVAFFFLIDKSSRHCFSETHHEHLHSVSGYHVVWSVWMWFDWPNTKVLWAFLHLHLALTKDPHAAWSWCQAFPECPCCSVIFCLLQYAGVKACYVSLCFNWLAVCLVL